MHPLNRYVSLLAAAALVPAVAPAQSTAQQLKQIIDRQDSSKYALYFGIPLPANNVLTVPANPPLGGVPLAVFGGHTVSPMTLASAIGWDQAHPQAGQMSMTRRYNPAPVSVKVWDGTHKAFYDWLHDACVPSGELGAQLAALQAQLPRLEQAVTNAQTKLQMARKLATPSKAGADEDIKGGKTPGAADLVALLNAQNQATMDRDACKAKIADLTTRLQNYGVLPDVTLFNLGGEQTQHDVVQMNRVQVTEIDLPAFGVPGNPPGMLVNFQSEGATLSKSATPATDILGAAANNDVAPWTMDKFAFSVNGSALPVSSTSSLSLVPNEVLPNAQAYGAAIDAAGKKAAGTEPQVRLDVDILELQTGGSIGHIRTFTVVPGAPWPPVKYPQFYGSNRPNPDDFAKHEAWYARYIAGRNDYQGKHPNIRVNPYTLRMKQGTSLILTMPATEAAKFAGRAAPNATLSVQHPDGSPFFDVILVNPKAGAVQQMVVAKAKKLEGIGSDVMPASVRLPVTCDSVQLRFH